MPQKQVNFGGWSCVFSEWILQDPANKVYFPRKINFEDLPKQIILMEARNSPPISLKICGQYYLTDV